MNPFQQARAMFNSYAGLDHPDLPPTQMSEAQVLMSRWVNTKVKHTLPASVEGTLGATEEFGELMEVQHEIAMRLGRLSHIELNHSQSRRYAKLSTEELRALEADAIADIVVFLMALCTARRLDLGTLVCATVQQVTQRDWLTHPESGHGK